MRIATSAHEFVEVTLLRRTYPDAPDFWDGNWLSAKVRAASHGLQGAMEAQFRVDELMALGTRLSDLHRTLTGQLEFWPMEPHLKLTFQMGKGGGLRVYVELQPDMADPARLAFELCLDQTFIPGIVEQLGTDLEPFPQRGQP